MKSAPNYVPVRRNEEHEWLNVHDLEPTPDLAAKRARTLDGQIPGWAAANPVVRYEEVFVISASQLRQLERSLRTMLEVAEYLSKTDPDRDDYASIFPEAHDLLKQLAAG